MSNQQLRSKMDWLIEAWCARRELEPLRLILNGAASINGLTDGWAELLHELQTIRAQCRQRLTEQELDVLIEVQHVVDEYVHR